MRRPTIDGMAYDANQHRRVLAQFLEDNLISARALCKASGLSPSALGQFLSGRVNSLRGATVEKLAGGATKLLKRPVSPSELRAEESPTVEEIRARGIRIAGVRPAGDVTVPVRAEMNRDLPILGSVSGGPGGLGQMNDGSAIDYALRPTRLVGRTDVAGFWVEDLSMQPAYKPGSLVIVEKRRPPAIGDDIVFELLPETSRDERRGMIKRLIALTPTLIKVEQFNPPKVLEFPRKRVENMMRVIPLAELFGV